MLKFSCEKTLLQQAVSTVSRAVAAKSSIPALEGVLLEGDTQLTLSGYNMQTGIRTAISAEIHQEVIDALFHVDPPMSAEEQKNAFGSALADALDKDCSYDVVQSVHEQIRARIEDHKESKDPEPLEMTAGDVGGILANSGVNDEQIAAFQRECDEQYGENAALNPNNIIESKKFEITTPEVKISIAPENSYMIEARVINGRKYLLIPADDGVEVNGIAVNIPNPQNRESC